MPAILPSLYLLAKKKISFNGKSIWRLFWNHDEKKIESIFTHKIISPKTRSGPWVIFFSRSSLFSLRGFKSFLIVIQIERLLSFGLISPRRKAHWIIIFCLSLIIDFDTRLCVKVFCVSRAAGKVMGFGCRICGRIVQITEQEIFLSACCRWCTDGTRDSFS